MFYKLNMFTSSNYIKHRRQIGGNMLLISSQMVMNSFLDIVLLGICTFCSLSLEPALPRYLYILSSAVLFLNSNTPFYTLSLSILSKAANAAQPVPILFLTFFEVLVCFPTNMLHKSRILFSFYLWLLLLYSQQQE